MDLQDVSTVPEYAQLMKKQSQALLEAQKRKGKRPQLTSREELVMKYMFARMMREGQSSSNFNMQTTFIPPAYAPSIIPLANLTKVMINNLRLETHHRGSYVLLRSIVPADRISAVFSIVEDEVGSALTFSLYYQGRDRAVEDILPQGTVSIVKEPYLKVMGDGNCGIRVDHVTDISYLSMENPLMPAAWRQTSHDDGANAEDIKVRGNEHFHKGKYYAAIDSYTKGLDRDPTEEEFCALKLNRALAQFKTHQLDSALSDIDSVVGVSKQTEKTLLRKSQILYEMQQFRSCCDILNRLLSDLPNNETAKDLLSRATERVAEQEQGRYQFEKMQTQASKLRPPYLDHATYVGPVAIKTTASRGRAFAFAFASDNESKKKTSLLINPETNRVTMGAQAELLEIMVQKLYQNPSLIPGITELHHGSYQKVETSKIDGSPVVDTFLLERILQLNVFGCPPSTREISLSQMKMEAKKYDENFHSCGIWKMASFINHSCISNACRSFIGDMMIIRASRDLPPDTEVVFEYRFPDLDEYGEFQKKLEQWGFKCDCKMCEERPKTKKSTQTSRKVLRANAMAVIKTGKTTRIDAIMKDYEKTYTGSSLDVPRLDISVIQFGLARMNLNQNRPEKAVEYALKGLCSLGFVVKGGDIPRLLGTTLTVETWGVIKDHVIDGWMILSHAYCYVAPELVSQAKAYARISYRICIGEDETFDKAFERDLV